MKKTVCFLSLIVTLILGSCNKVDKDPRLVVITYDGLRWQEVFRGADSSIINNPKFVPDINALKSAYWRETKEERREALMPFTWSYAATHGFLLGNRDKGSRMQVDNSMSFSYPGYSEMFCGYADDERITSNDPVGNPNTSVLEVVNRDPRYKGKVMMYASWGSIRFAVNNDRGGFPGSAQYEPGLSDTPVTKLLDQMQDAMPRNWGEERYDAFTFGYAMETLKKDHPKVFYVGFGDTDEFAHDNRYDRYLDITNRTDGFIRSIVEYCESDPFYKGKTTYMLLCDHGRGRGEKWHGHGADLRGSGETWFVMFGAGVPVLGETSDNGVFYNKQLAATIADVLGVEFTPDNGVKCDPLDPAYHQESGDPVASASFEALKVKPKGHGVKYTYHEGTFMSVKEVLASPVAARGVTPFFSTSPKKREDHFGFVYNTLMEIEKTGLYQLSLATDDGSKLYLDGELVFDIDRDGGGINEKWLNLDAGFHRIEIQYFENYGGETIEVGLVGPGIDVEQLPASMLWYD